MMSLNLNQTPDTEKIVLRITAIRKDSHVVRLITAGKDIVNLSYPAWQDFMRARGFLSLPFDLELKANPDLCNDVVAANSVRISDAYRIED